MAISFPRLLVVQAGVLVVLTVNLWSQEAPQSFDSQNGLLSQQQFIEARKAFEEIETPEKGLGIHFNEASCAACHLAPGARRLPGGSGPITEIRAGFLGFNKEFFPLVFGVGDAVVYRISKQGVVVGCQRRGNSHLVAVGVR